MILALPPMRAGYGLAGPWIPSASEVSALAEKEDPVSFDAIAKGIGLALEAGAQGFSAYQGLQQQKLAEDALKIQKRQAEAQVAALRAQQAAPAGSGAPGGGALTGGGMPTWVKWALGLLGAGAAAGITYKLATAKGRGGR